MIRAGKWESPSIGSRRRHFPQGDRIQFTAPNHGIEDCEPRTGNLEGIDPNGAMRVNLDSGRRVNVDPRGIRIWIMATPSRAIQPGTDGRSRAHPRRYRSRCQGSAQQPHGLRMQFRAANGMHRFLQTTGAHSQTRLAMTFRTRAHMQRNGR